MRNSIVKKFNKKCLIASILSAALLSQTQAAPMLPGSILSIDQGSGSGSVCTTGSCFGMEVVPYFIVWTDFGSGTDGGIMVGKNQVSGGQENQPTPGDNPAFAIPGEVTNAWGFFSNYGTFSTPQGATNIFADTNCSFGSCGGKTELNSWDIAWNGSAAPMGSANGCQSPVCLQNTVRFFDVDYTIALDANGAGPYSLRYESVVPDGDSSGFGNVIFSLILRGTAVSSTPTAPIHSPIPTPMLFPNGTLLSIGKGPGYINQLCGTGSCFGMEVAPGFVAWTDFGPGIDGGIIVGKNQVSGGQENQATPLYDNPAFAAPGEMANAWPSFGNWGIFFTPQGATNIFSDQSCAGAVCIGVTELNSWDMAWNGNTTPLGRANGCLSARCSSDQLAGIFVTNWSVNNADGTYRLDYSSVVPNGDLSGFDNNRFTLILRGVIVPDGSIFPEANFDRPGGIVNQPVQFTDTSRFIGNGISTASLVSWLWDFGDGHTSAQQNPVHTYTQVNEYAVTLTVEDDQANVNTLIQVIVVNPIPSPTPTPAIPPTPTTVPTPTIPPTPSPTPTLAPGVTPTPTFTPTLTPAPVYTPTFTPTPTPTPTIAPITNDCTDLFPSVDMMLDGKGHESAAVESTLSVTFSGHIVSVEDAGKKIKICPGTELEYSATATVGETKCHVKKKASRVTGALTHKDKLTCTNKPIGDDTDRFKVKRAKKKDYLPGFVGEDPVKKSKGWHH